MQQQQQQQQQSEKEHQNETAAVSQPSAANSVAIEQSKAVNQMNVWLDGQRSRVESVSAASQSMEAHSVLQVVETTWAVYLQDGVLRDLPNVPAVTISNTAAGIFLPTSLTPNIRYFISITEQPVAMGLVLHGEASDLNIDWNTRLGIPEYRTQSDNLVAPEASCNVTTFAMVLERLGIGRDQVASVLDQKMGVSLVQTPEAQSESWIDATLEYLNTSMKKSMNYQRVRGQTAIGKDQQSNMAAEYRDRAQMEDLLDLLAHEIGVSRTSVISSPNRMLETITGGVNTPTTEQIWNRNWDSLSERVESCLQAGGAAALSFKHKGSRSKSTHIVSILEVKEDGFVIDDPYGVVREDYNPRNWDDAYWSKRDNGSLINSRSLSEQRNEIGNTNEWGIGWARDLQDEEKKGQETVLSKEQIERSMFYVQLFHRQTETTSEATSE